jgi:hypothetical protein
MARQRTRKEKCNNLESNSGAAQEFQRRNGWNDLSQEGGERRDSKSANQRDNCIAKAVHRLIACSRVSRFQTSARSATLIADHLDRLPPILFWQHHRSSSSRRARKVERVPALTSPRMYHFSLPAFVVICLPVRCSPSSSQCCAGSVAICVRNPSAGCGCSRVHCRGQQTCRESIV